MRREVDSLHRAIQDGVDTMEVRSLLDDMDAVQVGSVDPAALGFAGARLLAVRNRPQVGSPLPGFIDPLPALRVPTPEMRPTLPGVGDESGERRLLTSPREPLPPSRRS